MTPGKKYTIMATAGFLFSFVGRILGRRSFTGPAIINAAVVLGLGLLISTGRI